jgi:N-carbamoyl-L-amino-acid hydrolase
MDEFAAALRAFCARGLADGVPARVHEVSTSPPTACDPRLRAILREACDAQKLRCTELPSGAGHDAVYMAKLGPAAMIFIPCREGRSHFADEWSEPGQLSRGAAVLLDAILRCDRTLSN